MKEPSSRAYLASGTGEVEARYISLVRSVWGGIAFFIILLMGMEVIMQSNPLRSTDHSKPVVHSYTIQIQAMRTP